MRLKKHLVPTIIFCLTSAITFAQSLQISDESGIVPNGTELYVWGDSGLATLIKKELDVRNISGGTIDVKVKKIETTMVTGSSSLICFAGACYPSYIFVSTNSSTLIQNGLDTSFAGDYKPKGHLGESIITYVFFDINNINDSAWVTVRFNATPVAVSEAQMLKPSISNPYPNPANLNCTISYSVPKSINSAKFVLQDIIGSKVAENCINDKEGKLTINTSLLTEGLYFYSFFLDGKLFQTRKLIIKH